MGVEHFFVPLIISRKRIDFGTFCRESSSSLKEGPASPDRMGWALFVVGDAGIRIAQPGQVVLAQAIRLVLRIGLDRRGPSADAGQRRRGDCEEPGESDQLRMHEQTPFHTAV